MMTRFVAKQLSSSHYYDLTAAKNDFGYKERYHPMMLGNAPLLISKVNKATKQTINTFVGMQNVRQYL